MNAPVHRPSPPPRRAVAVWLLLVCAAIAVWLLLVCAAIAVMVVLGGVTRLAHAGLSIVEWRPVTGVLPPRSDAEWEEAFAAYRQFPEYQKLNRGMDLSQFKSIYWLEYLHRLLGRLIGVLFLLPFLWFLARRTISGALAVKLVGMFLLGGAQGVLGWYMVKSGLADRPDVSAYRLSAHLGLALLILWLRPVAGPGVIGRRNGTPGLRTPAHLRCRTHRSRGHHHPRAGSSRGWMRGSPITPSRSMR